ncbi:MAG: amino acid--tRNA ligase-related protein [Nanoarchaeota archaeon]
MTSDTIKTGLGTFSKDKFSALVTIRAAALKGIRDAIQSDGFTEVTTSSLVNIAGSCENPHASFTLNFYGREAHLSQSAQLQLEALVMRLKKGFFTVNTSFREEHFDDPEAAGRRLSEFTLIEPECPFSGLNPEDALGQLIEKIEKIMKQSTADVLRKCRKEISTLGGDPDYLQNVIDHPFQTIRYDDAIKLLNTLGFQVSFGDDLGFVKSERSLPNLEAHQPL